MMPDDGMYAKVPRPESVKWLSEILGGRKSVTNLEVQGQVLSFDRNGKSSLRVFLTNIYIVSEADVTEILAANDVDTIVTMSAWNQYSKDAKSAAKRAGVALFTAREFLGAENFDGQQYLDYTSPEMRKKGA